jgi:hypothetical protein
MAPATKQKKWRKADGKKLQELVNQPGNNITLSCYTEHLKLLHSYWAERDYKGFATLFKGSWRS